MDALCVPSGTRVLVRDRRKALTLRNAPDAERVSLVFVHGLWQAGNRGTSDQGTDRAGRAMDPAMGARSSVAQTDWRDLTERKSVRDAAHALEGGRRYGSLARLVVVVPTGSGGTAPVVLPRSERHGRRPDRQGPQRPHAPGHQAASRRRPLTPLFERRDRGPGTTEPSGRSDHGNVISRNLLEATMSMRLGAIALVLGLATAACTAYETRTVVAPRGDDVCVAYGFMVGTPEYRQCAMREADARRRGRMAPTYGDQRIVADAQEACQTYGLARGSERYERCVQREVDYRRPG
ncbi:MAG: host attachment protein [Rhodospirillales bacterium]|nr:MAG: host attachment protein [Rhodospirillales bacterium]